MMRNVLGDELETCGCDPMTGFYRTGCCDTGAEDMGVHTVCAVVSARRTLTASRAARTSVGRSVG